MGTKAFSPEAHKTISNVPQGPREGRDTDRDAEGLSIVPELVSRSHGTWIHFSHMKSDLWALVGGQATYLSCSDCYLNALKLTPIPARNPDIILKYN